MADRVFCKVEWLTKWDLQNLQNNWPGRWRAIKEDGGGYVCLDNYGTPKLEHHVHFILWQRYSEVTKVLDILSELGD